MSATTDNTKAILELTEKVAELATRCEVLTERLKMMERVSYGIIALILSAVFTALLKVIGL